MIKSGSISNSETAVRWEQNFQNWKSWMGAAPLNVPSSFVLGAVGVDGRFKNTLRRYYGHTLLEDICRAPLPADFRDYGEARITPAVVTDPYASSCIAASPPFGADAIKQVEPFVITAHDTEDPQRRIRGFVVRIASNLIQGGDNTEDLLMTDLDGVGWGGDNHIVALLVYPPDAEDEEPRADESRFRLVVPLLPSYQIFYRDGQAYNYTPDQGNYPRDFYPKGLTHYYDWDGFPGSLPSDFTFGSHGAISTSLTTSRVLPANYPISVTHSDRFIYIASKNGNFKPVTIWYDRDFQIEPGDDPEDASDPYVTGGSTRSIGWHWERFGPCLTQDDLSGAYEDDDSNQLGDDFATTSGLMLQGYYQLAHRFVDNYRGRYSPLSKRYQIQSVPSTGQYAVEYHVTLPGLTLLQSYSSALSGRAPVAGNTFEPPGNEPTVLTALGYDRVELFSTLAGVDAPGGTLGSLGVYGGQNNAAYEDRWRMLASWYEWFRFSPVVATAATSGVTLQAFIDNLGLPGAEQDDSLVEVWVADSTTPTAFTQYFFSTGSPLISSYGTVGMGDVVWIFYPEEFRQLCAFGTYNLFILNDLSISKGWTGNVFNGSSVIPSTDNSIGRQYSTTEEPGDTSEIVLDQHFRNGRLFQLVGDRDKRIVENTDGYEESPEDRTAYCTIRWSNLSQPEILPYANSYPTRIDVNAYAKFVGAGQFTYLFGDGDVFQIYDGPYGVETRRVSEGLVLPSWDAVCEANGMLFGLFEGGAKFIEPESGSIVDVPELDRVVFDLWGDLSSVDVDYDPSVGAIYLLNAPTNTAVILWLSTETITVLENCPFAFAARCRWIGGTRLALVTKRGRFMLPRRYYEEDRTNGAPGMLAGRNGESSWTVVVDSVETATMQSRPVTRVTLTGAAAEELFERDGNSLRNYDQNGTGTLDFYWQGSYTTNLTGERFGRSHPLWGIWKNGSNEIVLVFGGDVAEDFATGDVLSFDAIPFGVLCGALESGSSEVSGTRKREVHSIFLGVPYAEGESLPAGASLFDAGVVDYASFKAAEPQSANGTFWQSRTTAAERARSVLLPSTGTFSSANTNNMHGYLPAIGQLLYPYFRCYLTNWKADLKELVVIGKISPSSVTNGY
jgi:hypothetical protein